MASTFNGGIKLKSRKARTSALAIRDVPAPARVVIPLLQHVGCPARPVVKAGDRVRIGTTIGEADGALSALVHSSVSGVVRSLGDFAHPSGSLLPAVEIENDGREEAADCSGRQDLLGASADTVREAIRRAGIVGLGGGGFPTDVKLTPEPGAQVDCVILNGVECEPYLTGDHRIMLEHPFEVVEGLRLMMRLVDARRGVIALERGRGDEMARLRQAAKADRSVAVVGLRAKYPQGSEKHLVKALTGRVVPHGGLPTSVGCLVHNVGTSAAVCQALKLGRPLTSRVLTVAGSAAMGAGNFRVRIGTLASEVVSFAGGASDRCRKAIMGGPMTGTALATLEVPVTKVTTGIILLGSGEVSDGAAGPCIRCGRCVERCPMRLMPNDLSRLVETGRIDEADRYGVGDCIECGVCAYVCPARIRHVYFMKRGKSLLAARGQAA